MKYTDDTEIWGAYTGPVAIVPGDSCNKKITYPEDMPAGNDTQGETMTRIGLGYDLHRLTPGRRLMLGGVHIPFDKGVCGKCYRDQETQLVDDVLAFPGHIACDSASRSELCVPIIANGSVIGEIDLDSPFPSRFTDDEKTEMEQAAADIAAAYIQKGWTLE